MAGTVTPPRLPETVLSILEDLGRERSYGETESYTHRAPGTLDLYVR